MHLQLYFIRKIKAYFLRWHLHRLFGKLADAAHFFAWLCRFSKWRAEHSQLPFNDFYNDKVKYEERFKLHEFIASNYGVGENAFSYLEFGVASGVAFKWWAARNKNASTKLIGFDVFTGLPEDFGVIKKGYFDTGGQLPDLGNDERVTFVAGLFQNTLPGFCKEFDFQARPCVFHLDADLYSATHYTLGTLAPYFKKGDILIFDEFGVPTHEFRAFTEFIESYYIKYEVLGAVNNYLQVAVRIV